MATLFLRQNTRGRPQDGLTSNRADTQALACRRDFTRFSQLSISQRLENLPEYRPGRISHLYEVIAGQDWMGMEFLRLRTIQHLRGQPPGVEFAVAPEAIQAVQFKMLLEALLTQEALERRGPHPWKVDEFQMVSDQRCDSFLLFPAESEAIANPERHPGSDIGMAIEADSVATLKGRRLANVVQQYTHGQGDGRIGGHCHSKGLTRWRSRQVRWPIQASGPPVTALPFCSGPVHQVPT